MKRVLFIAYFYPPLGGAGVQRPLKTIKYLKQADFYVDVLTVTDILFHSYDDTLLEESVADHIYRVKPFHILSVFGKRKEKKNVGDTVYFRTPEKIKRFIRGLFIIDDKIGWLYPAYKRSLSLIKENKYDCIVATVGPLTSGMVAYKLHKKTKLPFYVDYRDLMSLTKHPIYLTKIQRNITASFEKKMLLAAIGVFFVGHKLREIMISHFGDFLADKSCVVYNGYDESDFIAIPLDTNCRDGIYAVRFMTKKCNNVRHKCRPYKPIMKTTTTYIRYIGNFYGNTSVEFFINALSEMVQAGEVPENIKLEFVGNYYTETRELLKTEILQPYIQVKQQVPHHEAIKYMLTSSLLLLFVSTSDGESWITGKVFEYIQSQRPILAMVPEHSEVAEILRELGHRYICAMEDTQKIKEYLRHFWTTDHCHRIQNNDAFSRENQTNIIIQMLVGTAFMPSV